VPEREKKSGEASLRRGVSLRKRLLFSTVTAILAYGVAEAVLTLAHRDSAAPGKHNRAAPHPGRNTTDSFYICEESGKTLRFDPIRGYRLYPVACRVARVTHGEVEYVASVRGNAQGFPDKHDWTIRKPPGVKRFLVFGDSFTAGGRFAVNWPDRVEEHHPKLQLLNVSTDGGGLANWWSNLTRLIVPDGYEFDGAIFACYYGDTRRGFTIADHASGDRPLFARLGFDPMQFPKTREEALQRMAPLGGFFTTYIVGSDVFDTAIEEKRLDLGERRFWIANGVASLYGRAVAALPAARPEPLDESGNFAGPRLAMVDDIRKAIAGKPIFVVRIPDRGELIEHASAEPEAAAFADALKARYLDGADAFSGLNEAQIREHWFNHDPHWNQQGSDRFAEWIAGKL
jgi:hypothetical protein